MEHHTVRSWDRSPSWAVSPQEARRIGKYKENRVRAKVIPIKRSSQDTKRIRSTCPGIRRSTILVKFFESCQGYLLELLDKKTRLLELYQNVKQNFTSSNPVPYEFPGTSHLHLTGTTSARTRTDHLSLPIRLGPPADQLPRTGTDPTTLPCDVPWTGPFGHKRPKGLKFFIIFTPLTLDRK